MITVEFNGGGPLDGRVTSVDYSPPAWWRCDDGYYILVAWVSETRTAKYSWRRREPVVHPVSPVDILPAL